MYYIRQQFQLNLTSKKIKIAWVCCFKVGRNISRRSRNLYL